MLKRRRLGLVSVSAIALMFGDVHKSMTPIVGCHRHLLTKYKQTSNISFWAKAQLTFQVCGTAVRIALKVEPHKFKCPPNSLRNIRVRFSVNIFERDIHNKRT